MKHLKKFNESQEPSTKRLSVEDIEDYFLEFIDNGSMEFYHSGICNWLGPNKEIHTTFKLSDKFRNIQTIEEFKYKEEEELKEEPVDEIKVIKLLG